jgi:hypothetical protein
MNRSSKNNGSFDLKAKVVADDAVLVEKCVALPDLRSMSAQVFHHQRQIKCQQKCMLRMNAYYMNRAT